MNLEFDQDQRDLLAVTSDVCAAYGKQWRTPGPEQHRGVKELADIGVLGLRHPEPQGSGRSPVEAVLAAQICGAALVPTSPLVWADLVGATIPGAVTGEVSVTGAFDPDRGFGHGGRTAIAVHVDAGGAYAVDAAAVTWDPLPHVDPLTPRAAVRGARPADGVALADAATVDRWRREFWVLVAAHLVGVGTGAVEASVAYAKERHQFGRPIGSFQALKHLLADAYTAVELARSQVLTAALCWAEAHPAEEQQAAAAATVAIRAAILASQTAIQVHGGMGFTSEAVPHLYYKRALQLQDDLHAAGVGAGSLLHRDITLQGARVP